MKKLFLIAAIFSFVLALVLPVNVVSNNAGPPGSVEMAETINDFSFEIHDAAVEAPSFETGFAFAMQPLFIKPDDDGVFIKEQKGYYLEMAQLQLIYTIDRPPDSNRYQLYYRNPHVNNFSFYRHSYSMVN